MLACYRNENLAEILENIEADVNSAALLQTVMKAIIELQKAAHQVITVSLTDCSEEGDSETEKEGEEKEKKKKKITVKKKKKKKRKKAVIKRVKKTIMKREKMIIIEREERVITVKRKRTAVTVKDVRLMTAI